MEIETQRAEQTKFSQALRALVPADVVSADSWLWHPTFQLRYLTTFFSSQNLKGLIEKHQETRQISVIVSEKTQVIFFSSGMHPVHTGGGEETILKWHINL